MAAFVFSNFSLVFLLFMQISFCWAYAILRLVTCIFYQILCPVDPASWYNRVKKTNLMHNLFLLYFVKLYKFRAYRGPSSGGTTVCIQHLVLIILFRWLSVVLIGLELIISNNSRSQWPRGLRRRFLAARLLRLWVRIPLRAWIFVCCECCVLSGRGLCDGLIIRSEESYRMWRVVCDQETSQARRLKPARGL